MIKRSIAFMADSYKYSQWLFYDQDVSALYSYLESRGGRYPETVFFGLQYPLMEHMTGKVVTKDDIDKLQAFLNIHFGRTDVFNYEGWKRILEVHDGMLPLRIKAVPEGRVIPVSNVLADIESTDDECKWLVQHVETLLMKVWYPTTIASQSRQIRADIFSNLVKTGTPEAIDFKCHDFGYRGVTCEEQAYVGGASHLLSFSGSDTTAGILMLMDFYDAPVSGFSIPATEHSNIMSFGKHGELKACENVLDKFPTGMKACVSDTNDIYNCCKQIWGTALKDKILYGDGVIVIRPDSGDPFEVVPKVLDILWDRFEGKDNKKGYKVLNNKVRVIQGDGMDPTTIRDLYDHLERLKWSGDNLTVGSGGGLLMKNVDRDTQKFAIKASAIKKGGEWIGIQKAPITDSGKKSKSGRLKLILDEKRQFKTVEEKAYGENILVPVFENGKMLKKYTYGEVKANMGL